MSPLTKVLKALLVVAAVPPAIPANRLAAQTRSNVVAVAQTMFRAGDAATRVASRLRTTYSQTAAQTATTLKAVGYDALMVASALKTEYGSTGAQGYDALTTAGFSPYATGNALLQAGIPVPRDCIDQANQVVPCASFGGMSHTPVMGQLTWSPQKQGFADSLLIITGTNIPPLEVRIASKTLATVSATSNQVIVRLPDTTWKGPLTVRRTNDHVEGKLESSYEVVVPIVTLPWNDFATSALTGAVIDARRWLSGAKIAVGKCTVAGAMAIGGVGVIITTSDLIGEVGTRLIQAGAPFAIATAWHSAFAAAWRAWVMNLTVPGLPWYPAFALWPTSSAPAMANVVTPVGMLVSSGALELAPTVLANRIKTALGTAGTSTQASAAITTFATAFAARAAAYQVGGTVSTVFGSGTVPSLDPPSVPAGPVMGTCSGSQIFNAQSF